MKNTLAVAVAMTGMFGYLMGIHITEPLAKILVGILMLAVCSFIGCAIAEDAR